MWLGDAAASGELKLKGQRVLELGAGAGLPGLLAAQLGEDEPARVVLTDFSDGLLDTLRNNAAHGTGAAVECQKLNWDDTSEPTEEFDVIVAADVVYSLAHAPQLVQTVLPRLATGLSTFVVLGAGYFSVADGGDEAYAGEGGRMPASFSTRNGWAELKEALAAEGTANSNCDTNAILWSY